MPRRSGGGRPAPRQAPRPVAKAPPPAPAPATAPGTNAPSVKSGLAGGAVMNGLAFGTGSAIAHRAVDGLMGPRVIQHGGTPATTAEMDACTQQMKAFQDCIQSNTSDIGRCQFYVDMLNECQRGSTLSA